MESIIEETGGCGRYQVRLVSLLLAFRTPVVASILTMVFGAASRPWRCVAMSDMAGETGMAANESLTYFRYSNRTAPTTNDSAVFDSVCVTPSGAQCLDIEFDGQWKTVVNEWKLVCDRAWVPATIIMIQMIGVIAGNVGGGQLADTLGRKRPYFMGMVIVIVGNVLAFFSTSWQMLAGSLLAVGFGVGCVLAIEFNVSCENVLPKWRSVITTVPAWPLQAIISTCIAWLIQDWRYIHLTIALLGVPFLGVWWFVPESFRWYLARKRLVDAEQVVNSIAKINGHNEDHHGNRQRLETMLTQIPDERSYMVLDLFRQRNLVKTTGILGILWITQGLVEYSAMFGIKSLSGNLFVNAILFNVIVMPSMLLATYLNNRIGRRRTVILCYSVAVTFSLLTGALQYVGGSGRLVTGSALVAYLGLGTAWGPVALITVELYPTVVRNIGFGFQNVIARFGVALSPHLVLLDSVVPGLRYGSCAVISLIALVTSVFIPETRGRNLNDNVKRPLAGSATDTTEQL